MRKITDHIVNTCNDKITITVTDEPGAGGANHRYEIAGFHTESNNSALPGEEPYVGITLLFQNGPIAEKGVNGITQEVLLAIVADRLESFQKGKFHCLENAIVWRMFVVHWIF